MKALIVKDDARYEYTQRFLAAKGHSFCLRHPAEELDYAIFPLMDEVDKVVYSADFFRSLKSHVRVFSGVRNIYLEEMCHFAGLDYHVMLEDETVAIKNAVATSEGVIAFIIKNHDRIMQETSVLIIGYGRCGSDLARRLKSLGADVCTLVRNDAKAAAAWADGVKSIRLSQFADKHFEIIVNTVPNEILTPQMMEYRQGVLLVDIASSPHGFDINFAKKHNEKSALLPGLPGKYAIKTSGQILGEYVESILRGGNGA